MPYMYVPDNQLNGWNASGQSMPDRLAQLRQGQYQQAQQAAQPQNGGINWVQGEAAAKSYMVAPGCSVLLMDSEATSFYIKSSDASGVPLPLRIFDYKERLQAPRNISDARENFQPDFVTREEFNALAARIEAISVKPARGKTSMNKEENENG